MKSDLVDLDIHFRRETEKAYAVWDGKRDENNREIWVWLPKSSVERDGDTFTMPEWLAIEKELV